MALQNIIVHFPERVLKKLDTLATRKKINREQAVITLVEESLARNQVRTHVIRTLSRRQASPEWTKAVKRIERVRARVPAMSETELDADIREAVTTVRSRSKG